MQRSLNSSIAASIPNVRSRPDTEAESKEEGKCLLCGDWLEQCERELFDTRFGISGKYEVRRCTSCHLEQLFPPMGASRLKALYESFYNFGGETNTLYTRLREQFFLSSFYRLWTAVDGDISFHLRKGRGRLLDIGCNEGRGLKLYARNGFEVEGLEINETAASVARRCGFKVHTELLEHLASPCPYAVVVLSNVLEHSLDPRQMLVDVRRMLEAGGQVWISCPNSQSWLRRVFGKYWINWHIPFHISHFNPLALRRLLADVGFENVEVRQITPALWVTQSMIAWFFSKEGRKTRELRHPILTLVLLGIVRCICFPVLWIGNIFGHGDCLLATAIRK